MIKFEGKYIVDLPGLNDSRGPGLAFQNAVSIKAILTSAKSIKFIFI